MSSILNPHSKSLQCDVIFIRCRSLIYFVVSICEDLNLPSNATLLDTYVVGYDVVARVQCHQGLAFDDGELTKFLICLESGKWNGTIDTDCRRKSLREYA